MIMALCFYSARIIGLQLLPSYLSPKRYNSFCMQAKPLFLLPFIRLQFLFAPSLELNHL